MNQYGWFYFFVECHWAASFARRCSHVSPALIDRFLPVTQWFPATAVAAKWIPPDDCSQPAILWPWASPVYISLTDSHSNLPEQTYPSCTAQPLEKASLRRLQARFGFSNTHIYRERYINIYIYAFCTVPPCDSCCCSWVRIKIESHFVSAHLSVTALSSCVGLFFLLGRITRRSAAGTCQEMNSRLIQALNVLQMTTS